MEYFDGSSSCPNASSYVYNLTSSYTNKSNEASMVATSVVMFLLAALFFNLNLFSRLSDVSAILNPSVRVFLSTALSLFLPVMSYLFSEAKNGAGVGNSTYVVGEDQAELSLRARLILMWMLLVELLRKKVEAILVTTGKQGRPGPLDRVGRVAWLGYLVFFNVRSAGRKAVFGVLWVVAAAELVQRIAITELARRSFAYGKNAQLLTDYMAQKLHSINLQDGAELLKSCKYVVMGEENLVMQAGSHGYLLELKKDEADDDAVVTVGKIWTTLSAESDPLLDSDGSLRRLCLSYALFKLLRRRFEELPSTEEETRNCRELILKGLCKEGTDRQAAAVELFQVISDEVNFLGEYYHSVLPIVLASPFFLVINYLLFPIVVLGMCLMTVVLCGNGDVSFILRSIGTDNSAISVGTTTMMRCLTSKVLTSPSAFFATVDLSITCLLFLTFFYNEVWEFVIFLFSNWFVVSLLCNYTMKQKWHQSTTFHMVMRCILCVRNKLSHPSVRFKQFSVMRFCRLSMMLPTTAVPKEVKLHIMESLVAYDSDAVPLSNVKSALARYLEHRSERSSKYGSDSIAEVIVIWHIATILMEMKYPEQKRTPLSSDRKVATWLSKYCAYLVAFRPELLPDNRDGTERVYKDMKEELKQQLGCWGYYLWSKTTRYYKLVPIEVPGEPATTVLQKGLKLGKKLTVGSEEEVWKLLAELWTEIIVYAAPSSGEGHVKEHEQALAKGGEFITVLWALATHTGITRPAFASPHGIPADI